MFFCGLIGKNIVVSSCPMPNKKCMWKHRDTAQCCYTHESLSKEDFCKLVGLKRIPTDAELQQRQKNLQKLLLKEQSNENPAIDN